MLLTPFGYFVALVATLVLYASYGASRATTLMFVGLIGPIITSVLCVLVFLLFFLTHSRDETKSESWSRSVVGVLFTYTIGGVGIGISVVVYAAGLIDLLLHLH